MSKISKVLEELAKRADMGDEVARRGITAYHGTPHDFDKFSMDSIGTGEGAQAYGHGLYFAESEDVALGYRDQLTKGVSANSLLDSKPLSEEAWGEIGPIMQRHNISGDLQPNQTEPGFVREMLDEGYQLNDSEISTLERYAAPKGSMYQVEIDADPEEFLDYDKPIIQHSPELRQKLRDAGLVDEEILDEGREARRFKAFGGDAPIKGVSLLAEIESKLGGSEAAARALRAAGIKGVKYRGGNVANPDGSAASNYVIFDDRLISISKKYGISIPAAAAVLGGTMTPEEAEAGFIGATSRMFVRAAADMAESMAASGKDRDEIWKATGDQFGAPMLKGPEGVWKQEISDKGNYLTAEQEARMREGHTPTVGYALQGPDGPSSMVQAYPRLQDSRIRPIESNTLRGSFNPRSGDMELSTGSAFYGPRSNEEMASTLQHEGQHYIQDRENWAKGGSPAHSARMLDTAKQELSEAQESANSVNMLYEDKLTELGYHNARELSSTASKLSEIDRLKGYLEGYYNGGKLTDKRRHILGSGQIMEPNAEHRMRMGIGWSKRHRPQAERDQNYADYIHNVINAVEGDMDPKLVEQVRNSGVKNPYAKYQREINNARGKAQEAFGVEMETWRGTLKEMNQFVRRYEYGGGEKLYRDLAGEVEARTVQERLPMDMDERIANPPWEGKEWTETPPEKQVFIDDYGKLATATMGGALTASAGMASASDGGMGVQSAPEPEEEVPWRQPTGGDLMAEANREFAQAANGQGLGSIQQMLMNGIMQTAGMVDLGADVASSMAGPLLSAPGAIARYAADKFVPGTEYSAEDISQARQSTEDYFNYSPRTELGAQYGEEAMKTFGGAVAPYMQDLSDAAGNSSILGAMKQGYNYLGDKEKELAKAMMDISPI